MRESKIGRKDEVERERKVGRKGGEGGRENKLEWEDRRLDIGREECWEGGKEGDEEGGWDDRRQGGMGWSGRG